MSSFEIYRIIPNKGTTLIRAPPIVWPKQKVPKMTKVPVTSLIIDDFQSETTVGKLRTSASTLYYQTLPCQSAGALIRDNTV